MNYVPIYLYLNVVNSKDVRLPVQLQRAMAAEAEAAREARAKVYTLFHSMPWLVGYGSYEI